MEENMESVTTRSVGIRYGLILSVVSIAYFLGITMAGLGGEGGIWSFLAAIPSIVVIVLAHKYFKDNGNGFMEFGQGFGIGFWVVLISSIVSSIFSYVYMKFIDPTYSQMILDKSIEKMEEAGNMSDAQIDQAMEFTAKFMTPEAMVGMGIVMGLLFGCIIALLVTIFTKKSNPETSF
jgi:hypothetical protein